MPLAPDESAATHATTAGAETGSVRRRPFSGPARNASGFGPRSLICRPASA